MAQHYITRCCFHRNSGYANAPHCYLSVRLPCGLLARGYVGGFDVGSGRVDVSKFVY